MLALRDKKARDGLRHAEQHETLVHEVGAEVVDDTRAGLGLVLPAQVAGDLGLVAVEVGFKFDDAAEGAGSDVLR